MGRRFGKGYGQRSGSQRGRAKKWRAGRGHGMKEKNDWEREKVEKEGRDV